MTLSELKYAANVNNYRARQLAYENLHDGHSVHADKNHFKIPRLCEVIRREISARVKLDKTGYPTENFYSAVDAAYKLHTSPQSVISLIRAGVLDRICVAKGKYYIEAPAVQRFFDHYILASELAIRFETSNKAIITTLRKKNICKALSSLGPWIPAYYFRREVSTIQAEDFAALRIRNVRIKKAGNCWLASKARYLSMPPRDLRDLAVNHFKCNQSLRDITPTDEQSLMAWRTSHCSVSEACAQLNINRSLFSSRFISTNLISTEHWGKTTYVSQSDVKMAAQHLATYYSVREAAARFSLGVNTVKSLLSAEILKPGKPLVAKTHTQKFILKYNQPES
ncbi:hypothetical protein [Pseudomonas syringae]|uniref:hypothetical protein n=1 Tax=Pseudomonas syringae TaxID=317 RepID=UPI001F0A80BD|nr:hypothetical protein [Pseudomonas syringae]